MPKKTQKRNRRVKRKTFKTKKSIKRYIKSTFKRYKKGGENEKVTCCMCEREVDKSNTLIPRACLIKHGTEAAHRICHDCWWNPESGFAREGADHRCPGCLKNLPLTPVIKKEPEFVDLTLDDD